LPKIEDIRLFLRIAVQGSISAAARELAIRNSVASDGLKRLDADLGCTLANRTICFINRQSVCRPRWHACPNDHEIDAGIDLSGLAERAMRSSSAESSKPG
jgi:hypothetical protein